LSIFSRLAGANSTFEKALDSSFQAEQDRPCFTDSPRAQQAHRLKSPKHVTKNMQYLNILSFLAPLCKKLWILLRFRMIPYGPHASWRKTLFMPRL
jgi:hypothetical protein